MEKVVFTDYNKKDVYKERVAPLIAELKKICKVNKMPFFFSIATSNANGKTEYCNDGVLPGSNYVNLYDDQFRKHLLVVQGADVNVHRDETEDIADYIASNMDTSDDE